MRRHTSTPSSSGIIQSSTAMSGESSLVRIFQASSPEEAVTTS